MERSRASFFLLGAGVGLGLLVGEAMRRVARRSKAKDADIAESTIRLMTRIAMESRAVNLSQGFPNERPPAVMSRAAAGALLAGESAATAAAKAATLSVDGSTKDALNQYSFPYGAPELRAAIEAYYARWFPSVIEADREKNVTVVMGSTEGFACSMRALTRPGDAVVFFQPFHELYPSQVQIFNLEPREVTLTATASAWSFDVDELDAALRGAALLLFNDPHNPTGHCFSGEEKAAIARLVAKHDVVVITDEIYEHMHLDAGAAHVSLAALVPARTVVVDSISKTAKATGWRIGWVVASAERTRRIRGVHDQLVACCPTPLQVGVAAFLGDRASDPHLRAQPVEYAAKRDILLAALRRHGFGVDPVPRGAYYVFATYGAVPALAHLTPVDAAMYMTQNVKVACVPGDNFYLPPAKNDPAHGLKYLRFAFCRSLDVLHTAAHNLDTFLHATTTITTATPPPPQ